MPPALTDHAPPPTEAPASQGVVAAAVRAFAHVSADLAKSDVLRRDPQLLKQLNLPASFLKHADEQGVCGFAAVVQAIARSGEPVACFADWSVLGAPRYPGRILGGASITRFFDEGIRGISPHIIPQNSTHSLSGLISVGLGMRGPNFGAGGGPTSLGEGLVAALAFLSEGRAPGLWLVATSWDREPTLQKNGRPVAEGTCHALALALQPAQRDDREFRLELRPARGKSSANARRAGNDDDLCPVLSLAQALERWSDEKHPTGWKTELDWGAEIALTRKLAS